MDENHITRALEAGYTIRIVASTGALRNAPAGASFRSISCFEEHLERARTERNTVGAVLHWALHTDDRVVTYEGRFVFDGSPVDVCASMHRHSEAVLAREGLFPVEIVARARVARLAAAALAASKRRARAAHRRDSERVFELAVAMLQTSLGRSPHSRGELRVIRGEA